MPTALGQGSAPALRAASAIAYDSHGNLFIADASANQVFEATLGGSLLVVAGSGVQGFAGDGGPATGAELNEPQGLTFGPDGTLFIADTGNHRVRALGPQGVISTVGGTGAPGFSGDSGPATSAQLRRPTGLGIDAAGALLICDTGNHRLRRIGVGQITTVAGSGVQGFGGDGGPALLAKLDSPSGVAAATDGRLLVADTSNNVVRLIAPDGTIRTFAGTGERGFGGDGGPATAAHLSAPRGLAFTAAGELLIADAGNQRLRSVSTAGAITTVAGSGVEGASGDGAAGLGAAVRAPRGVALSSFGAPVVADTLNGMVRVLIQGGSLYRPAALASGRSSSVSAPSSLTAIYGQGSFALTVVGPVGTPQGDVGLLENGSLLTQTTVSNGATTIDPRPLGAGTHTLTLRYLGDGLNPQSPDVVAAANVQPLALTATASSASVEYGLASPQITGVLAGVLPQDQGQVNAVFSTKGSSPLAVGTYPIAVALAGPKAGNYAVTLSAVSGSLQVVRAGSSARMSQVAAIYASVPVTLSAIVASSTSGQPTGTVQLLDGSAVIAQATLSGGVAAVAYTPLASGSRSLSVQYLGDTNFLPSSSVPVLVSVLDMPDFRIAPAGSQTATTTAGSAASYTLAVSAQPGPFTGAISFSASGMPAGASLSFSPPQVVPGAGTANVTVTVQTAAISASRSPWVLGSSPKKWLVACVGLGIFGSRWRRRQRRWLSLLGVSLLLSGCGARTVREGTGGVLSQTYTLQITGTATNPVGTVVTHATPLTLTIQP